MKKEVQSRVEEAMQSLDGLQRAEANPYLWSKIRHRFSSANNTLPQQQVAWRLVIALAIVMAVNVATVLSSAKKDKGQRTGASLVADEYSITLPQSY